MTGNEYSVHKQVTADTSQIYMNWRITENWCLLGKASYSDWQEIPQLLNFLTNLEFCMGGVAQSVRMKHWHNEKKVVLRYFSSCFEISSPKSFSRTGAGVQDPTLDLWREAPRKASLFCYAMDRETVLYCPTFPQCWPMKRNYIVYQEIGRWHRKLKCRMIFTFPWTSLRLE